MRFPTVFHRRRGECPEGTTKHPELGSDKVPSGAPKGLKSKNGFHTSRLTNINGFPAQRIAVAFLGPKQEGSDARVPLALPAALYLHEDTTDAWLRIPGVDLLKEGTVVYFDAPCLIDSGRGRSEDDSHNPGTLDVLLVVDAPENEANLPDGEYTFLMGTDVSNPGC